MNAGERAARRVHEQVRGGELEPHRELNTRQPLRQAPWLKLSSGEGGGGGEERVAAPWAMDTRTPLDLWL